MEQTQDWNVTEQRLREAIAQNPTAFVGLKWRPRRHGNVPYWFADEAAVKQGYPIKAQNLTMFADDPRAVGQRCQALQAEMLVWKHGSSIAGPEFDGTFNSLIDLWRTDPVSPYFQIKANTRRVYDGYARKLKGHIGALKINDADGRDASRWFAVWADQPAGNPRAPYRKLAAGRVALAVLKAAVSFGVVCRKPGAAEFQAILAELTFPSLKPRDQAATAAQVIAARKAAHAAGAPSRALAYALQFETTGRQWDIIGQWVPIDDPRPSVVIRKGWGRRKKWIGPMWAQIDENMLLSLTPSKTENTTGKRTVFDLSVCPMVVEELKNFPPEKRVGPLIVDERSGQPYTRFREAWRADFKAAEIPTDIWNRDLRASGQTEASKAGAHKEDRAKVGGHSERVNAQVYDRDTVEAHRRVMALRTGSRDKG
jgi:hypothetical protein